MEIVNDRIIGCPKDPDCGLPKSLVVVPVIGSITTDFCDDCGRSVKKVEGKSGEKIMKVRRPSLIQTAAALIYVFRKSED